MVPRSGLPPLLKLSALQTACETADHILLCSDYDGTLVALQENPSQCFLSEQLWGILQRLTECPKLRVVIVSGRSLKDLKSLITVPKVGLVANHGLEIDMDGLCFTHPSANSLGHVLLQWHSELTNRLAPFPGIWIEDKGLSLTIHYRKLCPSYYPELSLVIEQLKRELNSQGLLVVRAGKKVFEIRPNFAWDKGAAVESIVKEFYGAHSDVLRIYFGDDQTDEDIFRVWPDAWTIYVGEKPSTTLANYYLPSFENVASILTALSTNLNDCPTRLSFSALP
jgi:trehalose-phosphatase